MTRNNTGVTEPVSLADLLDFGPWTLRQKAVVALAALAVVFDGLDIQLLGFAIPAIAKEWTIPKSSFASVLAAGLFGMTLGSVAGGLLGDRLGRRAALILSIAFFGLNTLGMASAHSLTSLLLLRFCAGLGIGGALPNAATLTAEYTPLNRRPLATTLTIVCVPLGGLLAGLIASNLPPAYTWRALFLVGGALPLMLVLILLVLLPESPYFLATNSLNESKLRYLLGQIGRPVKAGQRLEATKARFGPDLPTARAGVLGDLFSGTLARDTLALWSAFFLCLLTVYLAFNWLPSILTGALFTAKAASQGLSAYNLGGIGGAVAAGWWISLKGSRMPMTACALLGIASAAVTAILLSSSGASHGVLLTSIAIHGLAVNAVQTTLYALATHLYVTRIRATGVALALAVGRTGAILSAFVGARLLAFHATTYFLVLAATMAGVLLALQLLKGHVRSPSLQNPVPKTSD